MSQQIDNQIVKMQFDNASFEKNVQQSMSTLDKLKAALKFDKVSMTPLQQAFAETEATATKAGFNIRDIWLKMGNIIEQEVAQKVVNAGKKIANALSFEGINDGFNEYELKMGSIQTIMAGTGESLATVNRYLDDLNTYSDKTIYSFSDMTQNIGKFTNAGVKLRDAVDAIKGIANEAAVSGANANEASRAMYNFAQALSAGYVKLIDWKSIENANMATKEFKETLLEVAVAMGTAEKTADGMYRILTENNKGSTMDDLVSGTKNFNDSLQYQWMTTEVLTKALKLYATDVRSLTNEEKALYEQELKNMGLSDEQIEKFEQLGIKATDAASEIKTFSMLMDTLKEAIGSGWAMTWQLMIGDFEQAKALWTSVGNTLSNVIDGISDARNSFLKASLETGWERFTTLEGRAIPQSEKFREILVDLARAQGALTKEQYIGINSTETLMKSFHELGWVTGDLLTEAVDDYTNILSKMSEEEISDFGIKPSDVEQLKKLNHELKTGKINADEFAAGMVKLGGRENVIQGLSNLFHSLLDVIRPVGEAFNEVFGLMDPKKLFDFTVKFREFTEQLKVSDDAANTIKTSFTLAFGGIKTIIGAVSTAISGFMKLVLPVFNLFDAIFGLIGKVVSALTGSKGALDAADKFSKIGDKISDKYLGAMQKLADFINKVAEAIRGIPEATIFVKIHDAVIAAKDAMSEFWKAFVDMPVIQQMISDFNSTVESIEKKVTPVIDSVKKSFSDFKIKAKETFNLTTLNNTLTTIYNKVKQFINIVKDFATRIKTFFTNLKEGKSIVESFRDSFGDIIDYIKELKDNLLGFFRDLFDKGDELGSKFDLASIQQAIHDFVTNITPDQVTMIAVAGSFMLIAINMLRLSEAMKNAVDAFTGIGVALKNVINSYIKKQKSTILQVAEAIVIVAASLWVLSTIPAADLERALGAMQILAGLIGVLTVVLTACGVAMHKLGGQKSMVELASGLVFVSGAFMVAVLALKALEYVNLDGILPKILTLGGIMVALVGLSTLMSKIDKFSKGSLTMVAVSASLLIAAEAMARIGTIPEGTIDRSIDAMLKIMLGIAAITLAAGRVGVFSAVGLIAVVLTLDKLLPSIEKIVNYDYDGIENGLKKNEEMIKKIGTLVGVMAIIGAIAGNRIKGVGITLLSISATFGILLGIAKLASMMSYTDLAKGETFLWHMAGIIALLELCSTKSRLGFMGGKNGGEGSKAFTRIAVAMGILLGIAKLASMMEAKDLVKGELALLGLSGIILAMTWVASKAQKSEGVIKSVAAMIAAVSFVLAEVAILSMVPLGNMLPALGAILGIITALGFLAFAITHNMKPLQEGQKINIAGLASFIAAMAAVIVTGIALNILARQPIDGVKAAAGSMVAVIGSIALLSAALGKVGGKASKKQLQAFIESAVMVMVVAGVLTALTLAIKKFNLDPNTMVKASAAIAIALTGMVPALLALNRFGAYTGNNANGGNYKKMITAVSLAIGALAAVALSIGLLSNFGGDGTRMIQSATAIAIGLIAICAPLAVLGAVGKFVNTVKVGTMATVVIGAIGILAGVAASIWFLSNYGNPDTLIKSAQALAIALLAISVPIAVLGAVGKMCSTIAPGGLGAMAVSIIGAIAALGAVANTLVWFSQNIDESSINLLNGSIPILATAIGGVAILAVAIAAAGRISGGNFAGVLAGGLAMVEAIGIFVLIVGAIALLGAALNKWEGLKDGLITGLDFLVIIAGKIGEAAGALISGFAVGLTDGLPDIADNLSDFSERLIPFADNMKKISNDVVNGTKNLAAAMLYICAASFIEGLTRWLGLGSPSFDFEPLGTAVAAFCNAIKDVPEDAVKKANICSMIAKRLAEISTTLDATGGVAGWLFGEKDLGAFAENVKKLGVAIKGFCDKVKDLPENAVALAQRAADATVPMVELSKTLYGSGGIVQKIMGEKNLGDFGTNLTSFVLSLKGFVNGLVAIETISPTYGDLITRCAEATKPMLDLARGIQNSGGILARIVGENTLSVFGDTLIPFADALKTFVTKLNAMASEVPNYNQLIINVVACTKHLVELANSLENMGGVSGFFSGDNTLDRFGETLVGFGDGLAAYASSISGIDIGMIESANTGIRELVQLGALASGVRSDAFSGLKLALEECSQIPVTTVANEIVVGTPIAVQAVTDLFTNMLNAMTSRTANDESKYTEYGKKLVLAIKNGILRNYLQIGPALNTMINYIKTYIGNNMPESKWIIYGKNIVEGIKSGINSNYSTITGPLASMILHIKNYLNDNMSENKWVVYGKNIVEGIKSGIRDNYSSIISDNLASMVSSIKTYLDDNMKKSDYEDYGKYIAQGIAKGIDDDAEVAVTAARNMVKAINDEIKKVDKIKSPSKVTYEYGKYIVLGIANGISDYASEAVVSVNKMSEDVINSANSAISLISQVIESDIEAQPTIRPVLDTSDIDYKAKRIDQLFNDRDLSLAYNISGTMKRASEAKTEEASSDSKNEANSGTQQINFTQNNYSPKALNRYEIYRQTNNQIRQLKGALS